MAYKGLQSPLKPSFFLFHNLRRNPINLVSVSEQDIFSESLLRAAPLQRLGGIVGGGGFIAGGDACAPGHVTISSVEN